MRAPYLWWPGENTMTAAADTVRVVASHHLSPYLLAGGAVLSGLAALVGALVAWRKFGIDRGASTIGQWESLTRSLTSELAEKVTRIERQDKLIADLYEKLDVERDERVAAEAKADECDAKVRQMIRDTQAQRAMLDDFLKGTKPQ